MVNAVEAQLTRFSNDGGVSKTSNLAAEAAFQLLTGKAKGSLGLPHINVVVDYNTLRFGPHEHSTRETGAGNPLPPESIARLACDAVLQRVVVNERGIPIDVGRKSRTATDAQWHSLRVTYRSCAWKGCERPLAWCQAHHIHEWDRGGATDFCTSSHSATTITTPYTRADGASNSVRKHAGSRFMIPITTSSLSLTLIGSAP